MMTALMDPESFTTHVAAILQEKGYAVLSAKTLSLSVQVIDVGTACIGLGNFYARYTQNPADLNWVIDTCLKLLSRDNKLPQMESLSDVAGRLYPQVQHVGYLRASQPDGQPFMVSRPLLDDLCVIYRIDSEQFMAAVTFRHLGHWGITPDTLHVMAMGNLAQLETPCEVYEVGDRPLYAWCSVKDGYAATRARSVQPGFLDMLSGLFGAGRLLVGIPNRDFLVAFPDLGEEMVAGFVHRIKQDARTQPYSISERVFAWNGQSLSVYA